MKILSVSPPLAHPHLGSQNEAGLGVPRIGAVEQQTGSSSDLLPAFDLLKSLLMEGHGAGLPSTQRVGQCLGLLGVS